MQDKSETQVGARAEGMKDDVLVCLALETRPRFRAEPCCQDKKTTLPKRRKARNRRLSHIDRFSFNVYR